jgi:erythromycin esterase-like protein
LFLIFMPLAPLLRLFSYAQPLRHWVGLLLAGLLAGPAHAQDSTLTRLIRGHSYPLAQQGQQLRGAGWDTLQAAVRRSQYVLVGEDHGTAQVPQFTAALARVLRPAVYIAEIDPYVAQELTQLAARPAAPAAYLRQYPGALCFYTLAEEFDLVRTLRAQQTRVVGIDQVFAATAAPFYRRLAGLVKQPATRTYLRQRAAAYEAFDRASERQGSQAYAMLAQPPSTLDTLRQLTRAEGPQVQRVSLLSRNLLQHLAPSLAAGSPPAPKTLIKFGAIHLARGLSPVGWGDFYDVGNLVQAVAQAQGQQSLHLFILGRQGTKAVGFNPYFPARNVASYVAADYEADFHIGAFLREATGPAWAVIDLRPARRALAAGQLRLAEPVVARLIQGYDFFVVIPETTASQPL